MKLNLGCGSQVPEGWVNVDYALGARFLKLRIFRKINVQFRIFDLDWNEKIFIHDLTKPFPWKDSTVDVIYTSHTLEHFSKNDGRRFLKECHRVLCKNGIIRIVVPDLRQIIDQYFSGDLAADDFINNLGVLYGGGRGNLRNRLAPFFEFPHKCMYDNRRLLEIMGELGFNASAKPPYESDIENICSIELPGRTESAAIVEGRKQ